MSAVESDSFSKLAAQIALSSRLSAFCASANLLCFPNSLPLMFDKSHGLFNNYNYGCSAVVGQKVYVNSIGTKGGSSEFTKQKKWVGPGIFFRESMLKKGKVIPMPDINDKFPERSFLPWSISSKQSFSMLKVSKLKHIFHAGDNSTMETMVVESLSMCKRAPFPGETKQCVSSTEDMIDFAVSVLGRNIDILTMKNVNGSKQSIMIGSIERINGGKVTNSVSCHQLLFPYLLYYYHSVPKVRVYQVDILDPNSKAKINNGVAICHMNTSSWNPAHEAFFALGSAPGRIEVCHWIFQNELIWTVVD